MRPPLYDNIRAWLNDAAKRLGVDGGCFHLTSQAGDRIVCQAITDSYSANPPSYSLDLSACRAVREVLDTGALLSVDDARHDGRVAPVARHKFGLQSVVYCPIRLGQCSDGVAIFSNRSPHPWSDGERALAASLVSDLQNEFEQAPIAPPPSRPRLAYELMLGAIPGLVSIVDGDLLTRATSGSVHLQAHAADPADTISVDQLLRTADGGPALRTALIDLVQGHRGIFRGVCRSNDTAWSVHAYAVPVDTVSDPFSAERERHQTPGWAVVYAQPMAEPDDETLRRLIGTVAHEVNNTLQHITMSAHCMSPGTLDEERAVIMAAADRAARVTQTLLSAGVRRLSPFDLAPRPAPFTAAEPSPRATADGSGPRILIVEDEVELAQLLTRALGLKGYQARQCGSLAEASEAFDANPTWPDVIVFDIDLGDGSGIELFEHARSARADLGFVAISGLSNGATWPQLGRAGCRLLSKPFTAADLHAAVERALNTQFIA